MNGENENCCENQPLIDSCYKIWNRNPCEIETAVSIIGCQERIAVVMKEMYHGNENEILEEESIIHWESSVCHMLSIG